VPVGNVGRFEVGSDNPVGQRVARVPIAQEFGGARFRIGVERHELLDAGSRGYRWWFNGLHRLDFTAWLRARPFWDALMLVLLLGGIGVTATGAYLAFTRIRRDLGFG